MANLLFKLGRWTTIGALAVASAAACGGRGNLPTGSLDDDGQDGFGGANTTAGRPQIAGSASGGRPNAGSGTGGGNTAGTSAAGGKGCGFGPACSPPATCAGGMCVVEQVCEPGLQRCEANGQILLRCLGDGTGYRAIDCVEQGQLCNNGACRSLLCTPGKLFCNDNTLWRCDDSGFGAAALQNCVNGEYCDNATLSCRAGLCSPNQPACKGEVATFCNQDGSGYAGGGSDCSLLPDRHCYLGACLCEPNRADCNATTKDGCETDVASDPDNCAGCSVACSGNHMATRTCSNGCDGTCQPGYGDCNADKQSDGCEIQISANADHCGACGVSCSDNNIQATCVAGLCAGKCQPKFNDCNADKQLGGCESDSRSDADNCGACGVECSGDHVVPACVDGKCGGACKAGFADCNLNKQRDGCEIDTHSDEQNCGGCGQACAAGESCAAGTCSSLYTFSGIKQDLPTAALVGWSECYSDFYGESALISQVLEDCTGGQLMMACRELGSDTLQLAAYAPVTDVTFNTGKGDVPHNANGVGWYLHDSQSWGFAPEGDPIHRYTCDITDSELEDPGVNGDKRLCWHTSGGYVSSGWRCGRNDMLNSDFNYERVLFTAP